MHVQTRAILGAATLLAASGLALPADAAPRKTVKVVALDRGGSPVAARVQAVNLDNHKRYPITAGRARPLPAGEYAITALIPSGAGAQTLGTQVVSMTRSRTVSFDARKGRLVKFAVDDPTAVTDRVYAMPLVDGVAGLEASAADALATRTYAIPMKHRAVTFLAQATLVKKGVTPSPYVFSLAHSHDGGIPADVAFSDTRAKLARVDVAVRSFGPGQMGSLVLQPRPAEGLIYSGPFLGDSLLDLGALPRAVRTYRSPNLRWTTLVTLADARWTADLYEATDETVFRAGQTYERKYGKGIWGLTRNGALYQEGRTLHVAFDSPPICLTSTEAMPPDCRMLSTAEHRGTARIYVDGKLAKKGSGDDLRVLMPLEPRRYEVTFAAARTGAKTASRVQASWAFEAEGLDPGFAEPLPLPTVQFDAKGLDSRNTVARGGTTRLTARVWNASPQGTGTLRVLSSGDGGKTWKEASLFRSGAGWSVTVRNPGKAGPVALKAVFTEPRGVSTTQISYGAYGVR